MSSPTCPICGKPTDPAIRPFCSKRCADVDLRRWLVGGYAIPASTDDDEQDTAPGSVGEDEPDA